MECVSTGVLEKIKNILEVKIKPKNDMMYQDIYNCICQNTKKMKIYYPVCQTEILPYLIILYNCTCHDPCKYLQNKTGEVSAMQVISDTKWCFFSGHGWDISKSFHNIVVSHYRIKPPDPIYTGPYVPTDGLALQGAWPEAEAVLTTKLETFLSCKTIMDDLSFKMVNDILQVIPAPMTTEITYAIACSMSHTDDTNVLIRCGLEISELYFFLLSGLKSLVFPGDNASLGLSELIPNKE